MFVLLFGLSMDYRVFILSRIREGHLAGLRTDSAVSQGIKSSAGTVTAAAVVMVVVFLTFATLSQVSMKEAGARNGPLRRYTVKRVEIVRARWTYSRIQ